MVAVYPLLYLVDDATDWSWSPVLPGITVLAIAWMALPFLLAEFINRRWRRLEADRKAAKLNRYYLGARGALLSAALWFFVWISLGA